LQAIGRDSLRDLLIGQGVTHADIHGARSIGLPAEVVA
jgi:hypothetical protein